MALEAFVADFFLGLTLRFLERVVTERKNRQTAASVGLAESTSGRRSVHPPQQRRPNTSGSMEAFRRNRQLGLSGVRPQSAVTFVPTTSSGASLTSPRFPTQMQPGISNWLKHCAFNKWEEPASASEIAVRSTRVFQRFLFFFEMTDNRSIWRDN